MSRTRIIIFLALVVSFSTPLSTPARADNDFKRAVFESCRVATEALATLPATEIPEITSYLVRVVELPVSSSSPELFEPFAGRPAGSPLASHREDLHDSALWRTFQPSREIEAKRCAAQLLERLYPSSVAALPALVMASRDVAAPLDLRNEVEKVLWRLASRLRQDGSIAIDKKVVSQLLALTDGTTSPLAANILVEIAPQGLPVLIEQLGKPDDAVRERIANILLRIDDTGAVLGDRLLPLLRAGSEDVRERTAVLLTKLPGYYPKAFSELVLRLEDTSPAVSNAFFSALAKIASELQKWSDLTLDPLPLDTLSRALAGLDASKRDVAEQALRVVVKVRPEAASGVVTLITDKDSDLSIRAIRALSSLKQAPPEIYSKLYNAAFSTDIFVRIEAIPVVARFAETSEARDTAMLRILKGLAAERDPGARELLIAAVAQASGMIADGSTKERLIPYFIEALGAPEIGRSGVAKERVAEALVGIGASAVAPLRKLLGREDARVRERALIALAAIKPVEKATVRAWVPLLKDRDPAIRARAEEFLGAHVAAVGDEIGKALGWSERGPRAAAARLAVLGGLLDARVPGSLVEQFAAAPCRERVATVDTVLKGAPSASSALEMMLVDCLSSNDGVDVATVLRKLVALGPLQDGARTALTAQFASGVLGREMGLRILEHARVLGLDDAGTVALLDGFVRSNDDALKHRAVTMLGELFAAGDERRLVVAETRAAVSGILASVMDKGELALRLKAAVSLLRVGGDTGDARKLLLRELDDDGFQWALAALDEVRVGGGGESEVSGVLAQSLDDLPNRSRYEVLRVLAKRGAHASNAVPAVLKLVNNPDPLLRYHATFALVQIDSAASYIIEPLRRELIGDYGAKFVSDRLCVVAPVLAAARAAEPRSFVELRYVSMLQERCAKL